MQVNHLTAVQYYYDHVDTQDINMLLIHLSYVMTGETVETSAYQSEFLGKRGKKTKNAIGL